MDHGKPTNLHSPAKLRGSIMAFLSRSASLLAHTKIALLHCLLRGRWGNSEILKQFSNDTPEQAAWKLLLSAEGLERCCNASLKLHLHFIHNARLKVVRTLLPPGDVILDLGGAYSPL